MKKYKFSKIRPKEIVAESKRRDDEYFKHLEQSGFDMESIEGLKFNKKYKLDYPSNIYCQTLTDVIDELFKNSHKIHRDVMYAIVKGLVEIDIAGVFERFIVNDARMELFCQKIMKVVIENMESLYYFYEDEVFSELVFNLCNILDLDSKDYGFTKTA